MSCRRTFAQHGVIVGLMLLCTVSPAGAQRRALEATGPTFGFALGFSRAVLRTSPTSTWTGVDVAFAWRAGYQVSDRVSLLLVGSGATYRHTGPGRARRRGFETLMPMVEYRVDDRLRLSAGGGLQLDAPVFFDVRPSQPDETRYSVGLGGALAASYAVVTGDAVDLDLHTRWNIGRVAVPHGTLRGNALSMLLGVRR
ncbi:MAG: hypothetical protein MUF00_07180 [Gemmatimonadaceae bacterium]|nr:hypothetical protein [Gemmatimonadaceae bacterium]